MKHLKYWGWLLSIIVLASGCGGAFDLDQPPEIRYGEDICEACGMIISDPRFAAAYVTEGEEIRLFDDIGGLFVHHAAHPEPVHAFWIHDFDGKAWTRAENAAYVLLENNVTTPMGWGIAAFKNEAAADLFVADHGGLILTFDDLQEAVARGEVDAAQLHDQLHHQSKGGADQHGQEGEGGEGGEGGHESGGNGSN